MHVNSQGARFFAGLTPVLCDRRGVSRLTERDNSWGLRLSK